jgi:spore germination cell wall hydrolase CwlJ-like protein
MSVRGRSSQQISWATLLTLTLFIIGGLHLIPSLDEEKVAASPDVNTFFQLEEDLNPLSYTEEGVFYLTQALYFEDALGDEKCQLMVAHVIQNRMYSERYSDTIGGVVWQPRQFSFTHDGKPERMEVESSRKRLEVLAKKVLGGYTVDQTGGALHYYNPKLANPDWKHDYVVSEECGDHLFLIRKTLRSWE